jgi:hypothetical protein
MKLWMIPLKPAIWLNRLSMMLLLILNTSRKNNIRMPQLLCNLLEIIWLFGLLNYKMKKMFRLSICERLWSDFIFSFLKKFFLFFFTKTKYKLTSQFNSIIIKKKVIFPPRINSLSLKNLKKQKNKKIFERNFFPWIFFFAF